MNSRRIARYRPDFERLEPKETLNAGGLTAHLAIPDAASASPSRETAPHTQALKAISAGAKDRVAAARERIAERQAAVTTPPAGRLAIAGNATKPDSGYLVYRITNPNSFNNSLTPPFSHVLVQGRQPIPGQVYNVLYLAVRNGTATTFDANSGFLVRFPGSKQAFPILTGAEQWKPGQEFVFYVLTKKYYPVPSVVDSGFEFSLGGARSVGIPGPSGIFLRVTYNPTTFDKTLDWIVAHGPGAQGGKGIKFGLPDTAIYEFLNAKANRKDFGGYF